MWGFGHAIWLLLPLLLLGKFFWIVILALLIGGLIRRSSFRHRQMHAYHYGSYGMPPVQPSALETLRQRFARGEIDAVTFDQMRERLENASRPNYE